MTTQDQNRYLFLKEVIKGKQRDDMHFVSFFYQLSFFLTLSIGWTILVLIGIINKINPAFYNFIASIIVSLLIFVIASFYTLAISLIEKKIVDRKYNRMYRTLETKKDTLENLDLETDDLMKNLFS